MTIPEELTEVGLAQIALDVMVTVILEPAGRDVVV